MITIKPRGGLCNKLRVVFSYEYARKNNLKLNVIWLKDKACPGYFLYYFEPIPHVNFTTHFNKSVKLEYEGSGTPKGFNPKYDKLKPRIEKNYFR